MDWRTLRGHGRLTLTPTFDRLRSSICSTPALERLPDHEVEPEEAYGGGVTDFEWVLAHAALAY